MNRLRKYRLALWDKLLAARAGTRPVSIISNNCWGGFVSSRLGRRYESPFVGLFLFPDHYLQMLEDLENSLQSKVTFSPSGDAPCVEGHPAYPVGRLDNGVELHFLHAPSAEAAERDWERRKQRLNRNHLAIKICDRDGFNEQHLQRFLALEYPRKVCFVSRPMITHPNVVYVPGHEEAGQLPPDLAHRSDDVFDLPHWIKTGEVQAPSAFQRFLKRVVAGR